MSKMFKSIDGSEVHVALLNGMALVIREAREIPEEFVPAAMRTGRVEIVGGAAKVADSPAKEDDKDSFDDGEVSALAEKIVDLYKQGNEKQIMGRGGDIDRRKLRGIAGRPVPPEMADAALALVGKMLE